MVTYKTRKEPKDVVLARFERRYPDLFGVRDLDEQKIVKKEEKPREPSEPQPESVPSDD